MTQLSRAGPQSARCARGVHPALQRLVAAAARRHQTPELLHTRRRPLEVHAAAVRALVATARVARGGRSRDDCRTGRHAPPRSRDEDRAGRHRRLPAHSARHAAGFERARVRARRRQLRGRRLRRLPLPSRAVHHGAARSTVVSWPGVRRTPIGRGSPTRGRRRRPCRRRCGRVVAGAVRTRARRAQPAGAAFHRRPPPRAAPLVVRVATPAADRRRQLDGRRARVSRETHRRSRAHWSC